MDDESVERILERERRMMEQIRELDMEELQIEEVDDDHSSDDDVLIRFLSSPAPYLGVLSIERKKEASDLGISSGVCDSCEKEGKNPNFSLVACRF